MYVHMYTRSRLGPSLTLDKPKAARRFAPPRLKNQSRLSDSQTLMIHHIFNPPFKASSLLPSKTVQNETLNIPPFHKRAIADTQRFKTHYSVAPKPSHRRSNRKKEEKKRKERKNDDLGILKPVTLRRSTD